MDLTSPVPGLDGAVADALAHGRAVLAVDGMTLALGVHGDHVLVGPLVPTAEEDDPVPGGGCVACALAWWADTAARPSAVVTAARRADAVDDLGADDAPGGADVPPVPRGPAVDWAPVVREMAVRVLADPPGRWRRSLLALDRSSGGLGAHRFLVHPECPTCAPRWRAPRRLDLATPQPSAGGPLRTRRLDRVALRDRLVDARFGPVVNVRADEGALLSRVAARVVVPGSGWRETGVGRAATAAAGEEQALLRGLGRVLGGYRRATVPVTVARWDEVADRALDPRTLGGPAPARPGTRSTYRPFDPERATSWVWGRSTRADRPVLVPEHVAYDHERGIGARFLAASPTGRAVGSSREEAVLHALLQVVEHDALLLAWTSRARLVEIRPAAGGPVALTRDLLAARGLHLRVLDATSDLGVPVVLAVVTADDDLVRTGRAPATAVTSAVAADVASAVREAVDEAAADAVRYPAARWSHGAAARRYRAMVADHDLVRTADDHAGLHAQPEARPLSAFLHTPAGTVAEPGAPAPDGAPAPTPTAAPTRAPEGCAPDRVLRGGVPEGYAPDRVLQGGAPEGYAPDRVLRGGTPRPVGPAPFAPGLPDGDVAGALRVLVERVHARGMDVVVVDQSAPEVVDAVGLHAATVLVPGAVPLVHGHRDRRVSGLPRLTQGAALLRGAVADPTAAAPEAAPPHPFR